MHHRWLLCALPAAALFIAAGAARAGGQEEKAPLAGPFVVLDVPWGSGGWMLARRDGSESAPEGPMSFRVAPSGQVAILDQVSRRVVIFAPGGWPLAEVPIPGDTFEDLAVTADGAIVLLDRLARRSLVVLTPAGTVADEIGIEGEGIPEGGGVTAMLARPDGIWLEYGHVRLVRVLDAALLPCARTIVEGRLTAGGALVMRAERLPPREALIGLAPAVKGGGGAAETTLSFDKDVWRVAWLDSDAAGDVYAMLHLVTFGGADGLDVTGEEDAIVVLSAKLARLGEVRSPWTIRRWEQYREFEVTPDGTVYQMAFEEGGVKIVEWRRSR